MLKRSMAVMATVVALLSMAGPARASNPNGKGGDMPAFYDGQIFTINFKLLKPDLHHNPSFNTIYQCDACEAQGLTFRGHRGVRFAYRASLLAAGVR